MRRKFQGDYIWIEPVSGREFDVAIGARVLAAEGRRIRVRDDDGQEQWLPPERRIKAMHATSVHGVEDMISLGDLHEAGILRNLLIRYNENLIYVSFFIFLSDAQLTKKNYDSPTYAVAFNRIYQITWWAFRDNHL